jgi:O-antigen/teichoic acid export membrane protein
MANAVLLFLTFYADRLIVAASFDLATLAVYGVALQLALLPAQIVGRAAATLLLPRFRQGLPLAGSRPPPARPSPPTSRWAGSSRPPSRSSRRLPSRRSTAAAFRPDTTLAAVLGAAAAFRIVRTPLSQLAVAVGRTGDPARANLLRAAALGPALLAATAGLPLAAVAAAAALGEAAATWRALVLAWPCLFPPTPREVPA